MFCKVPFRSPADVSARQQSLKERRQNYRKRLNTRWTIRSFWWTICIIRNKTPCYITPFTWQTGATGVFVCWTGRPDRSPLHGPPDWTILHAAGQLSIVNCPLSIEYVGPGDQTGRPYILRNVLRTGRNGCVILSKRQMNRLRMPAVAPKYGLVTGKGIFGRFVFFMLSGFSSVSFPSVLFSFPSVPFRRSFHTDGRKITHRKSCPFGL